MADIKTKPTTVSVTDFLNILEPEEKRNDAFEVLSIMKKVTGEEPVMWGPSIVGFGKYHYKYDSGHEGDMCIAGFSPRKNALTIYLMPGFEQGRELMDKLGKYKTGKVCLYINKLSDINKDILQKLIEKSVEYVKENYSV